MFLGDSCLLGKSSTGVGKFLCGGCGEVGKFLCGGCGEFGKFLCGCGEVGKFLDGGCGVTGKFLDGTSEGKFLKDVSAWKVFAGKFL